MFFFSIGPTLDGVQQQTVNTTLPNDSDTAKVILVFFIGGCTFAEVKHSAITQTKTSIFFFLISQISALRFLSQQEDSNVEFVIATTKLINGDTFLNTVIQ